MHWIYIDNFYKICSKNCLKSIYTCELGYFDCLLAFFIDSERLHGVAKHIYSSNACDQTQYFEEKIYESSIKSRNIH